MRKEPSLIPVEITPLGFNVRTTVHEYGGGEYIVNHGELYFSNCGDQRLYRQKPGHTPKPLTPAGVDLRYADGVIDEKRSRIIIIREDHTSVNTQAVNSIVSIGLPAGGPGETLVSGNDFYSSPRLNPDCSCLAWLTWNHPNMPWDGTELWVGQLGPDGSVQEKELVAGGVQESIFQPEWGPDGTLYFISDATGWWNLYRRREGRTESLHPAKAEFGQPQWVFRETSYALTPAGRMVCSFAVKGSWHLAVLDPESLSMEEIPFPYTNILDVVAGRDYALIIAGSPTVPQSLVKVDLKTLGSEVIRRSREESIDLRYISIPESIEFPTENDMTAYAFYYSPKNPDYVAPPGEKPPLIVMSHGGPTASTGTTLRYGIQFWTSHGIAVVDVDYGGSTGYGREYRKRLEGNWGVVDVDDCMNAARYLADRGDVDPERLAITGGSAGGYTTLCALTFRSLFKAGASYYGISDLEALMKDTHKFESRYGERLVGPYPERVDLYRERSPIHYVDKVSCPMILLQGLEDKVVPPDQSAKFYDAVRKKRLPAAYVTFEGEQHGFRKAENLKRSIEAELYFYSRMFGFEPSDPIEPVPIENMKGN